MRWMKCWKKSREGGRRWRVTSSGTATVTLPTDEQILITREFDAPKHLVYKAMTTPELIKRWWNAKRGEVTIVRDRPLGRRQVALSDGHTGGVRGRLPRRVPGDRCERADRLDRGLRGYPRWRRERDAEHRHAHREQRPHDSRRSSSRPPARRSATRSSTPGWKPACRTPRPARGGRDLSALTNQSAGHRSLPVARRGRATGLSPLAGPGGEAADDRAVRRRARPTSRQVSADRS